MIILIIILALIAITGFIITTIMRKGLNPQDEYDRGQLKILSLIRTGIIIGCAAIFAIAMLIGGIKIMDQTEVGIVKTFGKVDHTISGGLNFVGSYGYAWSCSPTAATSVNSAHLFIDSSDINPENSSRRALGFPVRCVQLCVSREQRPPADFAEAKRKWRKPRAEATRGLCRGEAHLRRSQSGASNGGVMDKRGRGLDRPPVENCTKRQPAPSVPDF